MRIEGANELEEALVYQREKDAQVAMVRAFLDSAPDPSVAANFTALLKTLESYASSKGGPPDPEALNWTFGGSLFFCMTIMTTIGYGTFSPATSGGQVMVIVFGIIGLAISGLCIGVLTTGFDDSFSWLGKRCGALSFLDPKQNVSRRRHRALFFLGVLLAFWLACSGIFVGTENPQGWSFFEAFYYSFVTFTTIGFGDYAVQYGTNGQGLVPFMVIALLGLIVFAKAIGELAALWISNSGSEEEEGEKGEVVAPSQVEAGEVAAQREDKGRV